MVAGHSSGAIALFGNSLVGAKGAHLQFRSIADDWSAAVDYSLYRLPSDARLQPEFRAESPTAPETTINPSTGSTLELPPIELFPELSSPLPSRISFVEDNNFNNSSAVAWTGESLSSLVRPTLEHLVGTTGNQEGATIARPNTDVFTGDSSLDNEALLHRPPISSDSLLMQEIIPLAEVLDGYQSIHRPEELPECLPDVASKDGFVGDHATADGPGQTIISTEQTSANRSTEFNAEWVEDITCPDGQLFGPRTTFIKVWRMVNTGENIWPTGIKVVHVFGDSLETGNSDPKFAPMVTMNPVGPQDQKNIWTGELKLTNTVSIRVVNPWYHIDHPEDIASEVIALPDPTLQAQSPVASNDYEESSSSMVIMPDPTLPQEPLPILSNDRLASRLGTSDLEHLSDDDALSDSSSLSYVSVPRPSEDEDDYLYAASRADVLDNFAAEPTAGDYDVPYDSNTSEEE
ncbi:hypothetical protein DXG03_008417 [Asterophora parasitica]|uniref:Nbr1 FW domain-containing protein n=1 Tax=Asterophora parasitica TaxID=117018 RepID=A0A9P7GBY4_9AGAR|nr:hypothetical protein DXG03_008417 [Asterophora parasitica]